mgnify:FL=1
MAHFYIAGNAASIEFAAGERLVDILQYRLPDCRFSKLVTSTQKWGNLRSELQQKWGFKTKEYQCVVWTSAGLLIGNEKDFSTYVQETYGVKTDVTKVQMVKIASENAASVMSILNDRDLTDGHNSEYVEVNSWESSEY